LSSKANHLSSLFLLSRGDNTNSFFFFGGLAIPLTQAILAHLFSYNMQWAATKKEVERSNFFKEIPKIVKRFWFPLLLSFVLIAGMAVLSTRVVPLEWRVTGEGWAVILPLAYVLSFRSIRRLLLIDIQFDLWMPYSLPRTFGFLPMMDFSTDEFLGVDRSC
jgi:hypothetical protein